ncbi:B12-binding domain-containing radical SAM protein [bacterium]|nr:B12-binding domain-containing radical SAM protein [bacterium]
MKRPAILLVNPYLYDFAAYDLWIKPLGLLYIGAVLEENGCDITLLDALNRHHPDVLALQCRTEAKSKKYGDGYFYKETIEKPSEFSDVPRLYSRYGMPPEIFKNNLERIRRECSIDLILVTSGMTYWYRGAHEAIAMCREVFPEIPVLFGGIYATLFHEFAKHHSGADLVFKGESERAVLEFIKEKFKLPSTKTYLGYDDYPHPAYHLYPKLEYVGMMTTRGCPYTCSFCATHEFTDVFRRRHPQKVVEEIRSYAEKSIRNVTFYDDALFVNSERHIKPILRQIIDEKLNLNFHTPNGLFAKLLDKELGEMLVESGFKTIRLSYESKNPERQKQMRKVTDSDLENALNNLEAAGFPRDEVTVYLIMGLPNQTPDEVRDSIRYVHELGARISLSSYSPIPNTPDWDSAVRDYSFPNDNPLMTNKSVYPLKNAHFTGEDFNRLKNDAIECNRRIKSSENINISDYNVYA